MIEQMTMEDLDDVLRIEKENFKEAYTYEQFAYELQDNPCAHLFVSRYQQKIIGYIDYWITFDSCQLCKIVIDKDHRNQGYARQLMNHMIEDACNKDCEAVLLEVRFSNEVAYQFYEQMDFLEISIRKGYYDNPKEDAIVMGKVLVGLI